MNSVEREEQVERKAWIKVQEALTLLQDGYKSRELSIAITNLEQGSMWLSKVIYRPITTQGETHE